jgi:hypothetical protein
MPFCSVTVKLNNKHGANNEGIAVGDMNLTFKSRSTWAVLRFTW